MKDKNYSLIDKVSKERKIAKEYKWALSIVHNYLKKGVGVFRMRLQFEEVAEMISELGFNGLVHGTYHSIIAGWPDYKGYEFSVNE